MPKEEQLYWRNQKTSAPEQSKMAGQAKDAAGGENPDDLRREIESLRKQVKDLEAGSSPAAAAPGGEAGAKEWVTAV